MSSEIAARSETVRSDVEAAGGAADACAGPPSLERQLARLDRLAEAGMEMIEALTAQARGTGPKVVEGDVALAFGRVSRAVRLAVLLHSELVKGAEDPGAARQAEAQGREAKVESVVRIVKRVARDHCGHKGFALGAYAGEVKERLDNDDIYGLVATRPVGELVAMICDDLGLQPNWDHLAAEAWAQAEIESGAQGSPFLEDDDEEAADAEDPAEPEPAAARPEWRPPTFQQAVQALAADPAILAAARRDSG
jgi:hypothetical protein